MHTGTAWVFTGVLLALCLLLVRHLLTLFSTPPAHAGGGGGSGESRAGRAPSVLHPGCCLPLLPRSGCLVGARCGRSARGSAGVCATPPAAAAPLQAPKNTTLRRTGPVTKRTRHLRCASRGAGRGLQAALCWARKGWGPGRHARAARRCGARLLSSGRGLSLAGAPSPPAGAARTAFVSDAQHAHSLFRRPLLQDLSVTLLVLWCVGGGWGTPQ